MSQDQVILQKAQLEYSDVVLLKPDIIAARLRESGMHESEIPAFHCKLAKEALSEGDFYKSALSGLRGSVIEFLKVLLSARLASSCRELKPTITWISDFTSINRNKVSPLIDSLVLWGFVTTESNRRELVVSVTDKADLGIDAVSGNLMDEFQTLKSILSKINKTGISQSDFSFLENLEDAFRFAESAYDKSTLNYEVMRELHDDAMKLLVEAKKARNKESRLDLKDFEDFAGTLNGIVQIRKEAKNKGLKPITLMKTDEKVGRVTVYRIK